MPSMKVILLLSAIMLSVYFIDNCAGNPYPSIGNQKGKSKRLGNCAFFIIIFVRKVCVSCNFIHAKAQCNEKFENLWNLQCDKIYFIFCENFHAVLKLYCSMKLMN